MREGIQAGTWVILMNCHLLPDWVSWAEGALLEPLSIAQPAASRAGTIERVRGGVGNDPPVDASGKLPDGRTFANPAEFKTLLAGEERLAGAFLEQLATYALRRVMTVDDMEAIHSIAKATRDEGHGVKTLVRQLILSDLFQKR